MLPPRRSRWTPRLRWRSGASSRSGMGLGFRVADSMPQSRMPRQTPSTSIAKCSSKWYREVESCLRTHESTIFISKICYSGYMTTGLKKHGLQITHVYIMEMLQLLQHYIMWVG
ncbi:uncharacterized protein LOC109723871 isoform X2 [Ananas comosus]|uniref:Uncharacterized protein LOC109723871 isoform X2 n=1 Tax=Ananas comosus TaxID=4615 RepID=A0A6P5GPK4_ANACO|nr:uncharacterized protein LOC109723871 isoform X2 [Ananas comosus]